MNQTRQKRMLRIFELLWLVVLAVLVVETYLAFHNDLTTQAWILLILGVYAAFRYVTTKMKRAKL